MDEVFIAPIRRIPAKETRYFTKHASIHKRLWHGYFVSLAEEVYQTYHMDINNWFQNVNFFLQSDCILEVYALINRKT